jgi:hypothetical protein
MYPETRQAESKTRNRESALLTGVLISRTEDLCERFFG